MLFSKTAAAAAAFVPFANAHGNAALPKILGLDVSTERAEALVRSLQLGGLPGAAVHGRSVLEARKDERECGEGIGSCPQDKCCSISGCMYSLQE